MTNNRFGARALAAAAVVLPMLALAACQGDTPPVDTRSSRERVGGPMTSGPSTPLQTDPAGNTTRRETTGGTLTPGGTGSVGTTGPDTTFGREQRGAPLR